MPSVPPTAAFAVLAGAVARRHPRAFAAPVCTAARPVSAPFSSGAPRARAATSARPTSAAKDLSIGSGQRTFAGAIPIGRSCSGHVQVERRWFGQTPAAPRASHSPEPEKLIIERVKVPEGRPGDVDLISFTVEIERDFDVDYYVHAGEIEGSPHWFPTRETLAQEFLPAEQLRRPAIVRELDFRGCGEGKEALAARCAGLLIGYLPSAVAVHLAPALEYGVLDLAAEIDSGRFDAARLFLRVYVRGPEEHRGLAYSCVASLGRAVQLDYSSVPPNAMTIAEYRARRAASGRVRAFAFKPRSATPGLWLQVEGRHVRERHQAPSTLLSPEVERFVRWLRGIRVADVWAEYETETQDITRTALVAAVWPDAREAAERAVHRAGGYVLQDVNFKRSRSRRREKGGGRGEVLSDVDDDGS